MFLDRLLHKHTVYDPWGCVNAYATAEATVGEDVSTSKRKIDIDSPGQFHLATYRKDLESAEPRLPFAEDAARILQDGEYAMKRVLRPDLTEAELKSAKEVTWRTQTKVKFLATLLFLVKIGLMLRSSAKEVQALTKHFQVPKGEDAWRIISDARIFNWMCLVPPGVNLPFIKVLLLEIAALGATHAVTGDWRYWFYQLPINESLQHYFEMSCNNSFFRLACLPMGWSWSPRIAQCLGWGVILHRAFINNAFVDPLGVYEVFGDDPPSFIRLRECPGGKVIGLIFLWYDNVIVICKDPSLRDKWYDRLIFNCSHFNAKVKTMVRSSRPDYLGIHFWTINQSINADRQLTPWSCPEAR